MRVLRLSFIAFVVMLASCNKARIDSIKVTNQGVRAYTAGDFEHAEHLFKVAIQIYPKNAYAHYHLGLVYLHHKGKPKKAAEEFKAAIQYDATLGPAYYHLGRALYELGDLDGAQRYLLKATKLMKDDPGPFFWMGNVLKKKGDYNAADDYYRKAIKLNPHYARAFVALADLYEKAGAYAAALKVLKEDVRINKNDYHGYERMGHLYLLLGAFKDAAKAYTMALNLHPQNPIYFLNLGAAYVGLENYSRAAHFLRLFVLQAKGKWAKYVPAAKMIYEKVLELASQ